jgi:hypothetical protein
VDYDTLINGDYKLLLEPVAYMTFGGVKFAMTAHEAALYVEQLGGGLRSKMASLSHKNLPLSMFLEESDLGFPAWAGSKTSSASNADIKSSLGLGIVRFREEPEPPPEIGAFDYEYRVDTEVITAVTVSGGQSDPDRPVSVSFQIMGSTYNVGNVYYPSGDSQLAWVRWRTPSTPQVMTIPVTVRGGGSVSSATITVNVVDLNQNPPPNPMADDRNDSFTPAPIPSKPQVTSANWGIWRPWWYSYWVWHGDDEDGYWCDHGWWEFDFDRYSASLSASTTIMPDDKVPTANGKEMKSGYGIKQSVETRVITTQSSATTAAKNAVTYFPEFHYETYWRLLDRAYGGMSSTFEFKVNEYSTYDRRVRFTPIWYRDGSYTTYTCLIDCWTPNGMLSMNLTDSITIRGSLWDDWHVGAFETRIKQEKKREPADGKRPASRFQPNNERKKNPYEKKQTHPRTYPRAPARPDPLHHSPRRAPRAMSPAPLRAHGQRRHRRSRRWSTMWYFRFWISYWRCFSL